MNKQSVYYKQVQLLLQIIPFIAKETCFALKGGTAINLFLRDLPRLSVDIDLVYLPLDDRETAIKKATDALERIINDIQAIFPDVKITRTQKEQDALRIVVVKQNVQIKVELSPVLRGSVFPPEEQSVSDSVEEEFGYASMQVMSFNDIYAGKICAALDRQHPRDLFDIKFLLENEGLTDNLRKTFLVYLISHHRPISELLNPNLKDISVPYKNEFINMAEIDVPIEELENTREELLKTIREGLTIEEKEFLLSFKRKASKWNLLGLDGIDKLPAVQWKLLNLQKMSEQKHLKAFEALEETLK